MQARDRILIVFPDDWAPFSPTLVRLARALAERFDVEVLAFDSGRFDLSAMDPSVYTRVRIPRRLAMALRKVGLLRVVRVALLAWQVRARARRFHHVVSVDNDGATATWLAGCSMHYLSLEVERPALACWIVPSKGRSIIIQTRERLEYQFDSESVAHLPVFHIQNAPKFDSGAVAGTSGIDPQHPRLVYMGNLVEAHGLYRMLDLLRAWSGATLALRGILQNDCMASIRRTHGDLIDSGRLEVIEGYVDDDAVVEFLSRFDVGLCLYEPSRRRKLDFNYRTVPAGKMFNYFAAGLPVLASDLPGLRPVTEYGAGIQAPTNTVPDLLAAGRTLCANHEHYRNGALGAAKAFDFAASARAFANFLLSQR